MSAVLDIKLGASSVARTMLRGVVADVKLDVQTASPPLGDLSPGPDGSYVLTGDFFDGTNPERFGWEDGARDVARLYYLNGACIGTDGFLYLGEFGTEGSGTPPYDLPYEQQGKVLRKVDRATGYTTTLAGTPTDGTFAGLVALYPYTLSGVDGLLVCDYSDAMLKFCSYAGAVSDIYGMGGINGVCAIGQTVYAASYDSGQVVALTLSEGVWSAEAVATVSGISNVSPIDSDTLVGVVFGQGKIVKITISTGAVTTVASGFSIPNGVALSTDKSLVYFVEPNNKTANSVNLSTGTRTVLCNTDERLAAIACDGSYIYICEIGRVLKLAL